jgi:hypothetical protein
MENLAILYLNCSRTIERIKYVDQTEAIRERRIQTKTLKAGGVKSYKDLQFSSKP